MGLLDDLTNTFNKGAAAAERGARTVKLKAQVAELNKKRQQLAAQLGASLYDATKDNEEFRQGRESLYDDIAACDTERNECMKAIESIEAQAAQEAAVSTTYTCTVCGSSVGGGDLFCSGCGTSADAIKAQAAAASQSVASGPSCASCGAPLSEGDAFCMSCGTKVGDSDPAGVEVAEEAGVVSEDVPQPESDSADR